MMKANIYRGDYDYGASAFLFQLKPILEGVSDSFTDNAVDVEGRIKDNGIQIRGYYIASLNVNVI